MLCNLASVWPAGREHWETADLVQSLGFMLSLGKEPSKLFHFVNPLHFSFDWMCESCTMNFGKLRACSSDSAFRRQFRNDLLIAEI